MKKDFCPNCEEYTKTMQGIENEVYNVRGEPIEIEADVNICQKCRATIFDEERDSRNLEIAYNLYRKKHNILLPDEIRGIRQKYGLSQRALSRLLRWGEITIHRYENGALQDNVHDDLLRFIEDSQNMKKIFEANRDRLPVYLATRLEKRIASFLQEDKEQTFQISFERWVSHHQVDLTSGFKEYDLEKLKNVILYFVKHTGSVLKTKLNKLCWYSDFLHYKETSVSITGSQYICLQYGPVPDKYGFITDMMQEEGLLDKDEIPFQTKDGIKEEEEFTALMDPDESMFSEKEIQVMNFIMDTFCEDTSTSISDKSHQETAYTKCQSKDIMSYKYATELSLSLPQ